MSSFVDLALHERLLKALDYLKFESPTPVQARVIPLAREGRDIVVSAKTGSGKTGAFVLPMLERFYLDSKPNSGTRALILLPTRELALQTQKAFEQFARFTQFKCGLIIGGEAFKYQVASIRRNPEVIIATPGRLVEHLEKNSIDFHDLEFLVLDEADRMLEMGFAEDLYHISSACNTERQNMLFSATFNHKGFSRVRAQLQNPVHVEIDNQQSGHSHITQQHVLADSDSHKERLTASLILEEQTEKAFVFCNTRLQAQKVSNILRANKLRAEYIHGEITQSDRKQVLNRFRDGKIQVLVATDVAARGLDIKNVDVVINFSVPHSGDDYVHRVGRTGRAGSDGKAITLIVAADWNRMSSIERYLKIRLTPRKVKGLEAVYSGPKKLKKSGKAAGPKKKKGGKTSADGKRPLKKPSKKASNKSAKPSSSVNLSEEKPHANKSAGQTSTAEKTQTQARKPITRAPLGDGMSPLKKKR